MYEKFIVQRDHGALHWLLYITDPSGRLIRWCMRLSEFDFMVNLKKGNENTQADALSRVITDVDTVPDDNDEIPSFSIEQSNSQLDRSDKEEEEEFA